MNRVMFSSKSNEWATPPELFSELDAEFGFSLDPCATDDNHKCPKYYTQKDDGLRQNWGGGASILQPAIRPRHRRVGPQMFRGSEEARHPGGAAHTGPYGHGLLPRLHLPQGAGGPLFAWASALRRRNQQRTLPVYDCDILTTTI